MNYLIDPSILLANPFKQKYQEKINVILFAHHLIGTVRGKSANGLMIHSPIFNVVAIIDQESVGKKTSELCLGVKNDIPIYQNLTMAMKYHEAIALVLLIPPLQKWFSEIEIAIKFRLDIINTSFKFLKYSSRNFISWQKTVV